MNTAGKKSTLLHSHTSKTVDVFHMVQVILYTSYQVTSFHISHQLQTVELLVHMAYPVDCIHVQSFLTSLPPSPPPPATTIYTHIIYVFTITYTVLM